jgi:ppGpp synthetase/RelA/SpoT-type nucleotidyltranferase
MILSVEFQKAYSEAMERFRQLKSRCDPLLKGIADSCGGLFASRLKDAESLYSKVEEGHHKNAFSEIPDIYAATIALPVVSDIAKVCQRVLVDFEEIDRRSDRSRKPEEFIYDDLHLVVRLRESNLIADKSLLNLRFELQIKSLLQFAWSKATHETIYKGEDISWRADRLAAEARATLELIDCLLDDVSSAALLQVEKENEDYVRRQRIVKLLTQCWTPEQLPQNLRRCAQTIDNYLKLAAITAEDLTALLSTGEGAKLLTATSLTPAQAVLGALLRSMTEDEIQGLCRKAIRHRIRFLVTPEMRQLIPDVEKLPASVRVAL